MTYIFGALSRILYGIVISVCMCVVVCVGRGQMWIVGEGACIGQWWVGGWRIQVSPHSGSSWKFKSIEYL